MSVEKTLKKFIEKLESVIERLESISSKDSGLNDSGLNDSNKDEQPYSPSTVQVDSAQSTAVPEPSAEVASYFINNPIKESGVQPAPIGLVSPLTVDGQTVCNDGSFLNEEDNQTENNGDKDMAHTIHSSDGIGPDITVWDGDEDHTGEPTPLGAHEEQSCNREETKSELKEGDDKAAETPTAKGIPNDEDNVKTTDPDSAVFKTVDDSSDAEATAVSPNHEKVEAASDITEKNNDMVTGSAKQVTGSDSVPAIEDDIKDANSPSEVQDKDEAFPTADANDEDKEVAHVTDDVSNASNVPNASN